MTERGGKMTYEEKIANFQNCQKMSTHRSKKPYKSSLNKLKKKTVSGNMNTALINPKAKNQISYKL